MPTTEITYLEWAPKGACFGVPLKFDPDQDGDYPDEDATLTCGGCAVRVQCLNDALENESPDGEWGIWGGTTPKQRQKLKRDRSRVKCPGCGAADSVAPWLNGEICLACGISWRV